MSLFEVHIKWGKNGGPVHLCHVWKKTCTVGGAANPHHKRKQNVNCTVGRSKIWIKINSTVLSEIVENVREGVVRVINGLKN